MVGGVAGAQGAPDGAVALEAAAEGDLPDAVAALDAHCGLDAGEDVPDGGGGGVAVAVEGVLGEAGELGPKLELLLDLVDDALSAYATDKQGPM